MMHSWDRFPLGHGNKPKIVITIAIIKICQYRKTHLCILPIPVAKINSKVKVLNHHFSEDELGKISGRHRQKLSLMQRNECQLNNLSKHLSS